jgi:hypothetical protein
MNKTNLPNWLSALCAALVVVLLIVQSKQKAELDSLRQQQTTFASAADQRHQETTTALAKIAEQTANLGTRLESRLALSEQQTKEKTAELANIVQQQTAVMHRALGKVIPVELPESLTKKLGALEARIADDKSWPKDAAEADAMLAELRELVRQIPSWAEEDLLPSLNAVRWGASGLALVAKSQTVTNGALADFLENVDTAIEAKPDGASEKVLNQLTDIQTKLKTQFDAFRRNNAIAEAERLLKAGATSAEFSEALEGLSEWAGVPDFKEQLEKLQNTIRAHVLSDYTGKFMTSVDASLSRTTNEPSVMIRQVSLGKLLDSVVSQRESVRENPNADETLTHSLAEQAVRIEKAIEAEGRTQVAEQERKLRDYQGWALSQIQKFNEDMNRAEGTRVPSGVYDSNDYVRITIAMTEYLVPVSAGLLDPAVSRLYNEAFERGWKKLENKKDFQTEVAKQEAVVEKHKP